MGDIEQRVGAYYFANPHEYKEAKRETETVEYIKANTDLSDMNKMVKLYHKLVERNTLKTVVGYEFLKELREQITEKGIITEESLPAICIERSEKEIRVYSGEIDHDAETRHLATIEDIRIKLRNTRIISIFLVFIIVAMILISVFSDRNIFSNYEDKIIDKYSVWEEELNAREKALEEQEALENGN